MLGFTGLSRVVLNVSNAVVLVLPLVALVATSQTIVRARTTGFFELFLAQPCRRGDWFVAVARVARRRRRGSARRAAPARRCSAGAGEAASSRRSSRAARSSRCALVWAFVGVGLLASRRRAHARARDRLRARRVARRERAPRLRAHRLLLTTRIAPGASSRSPALNPVEAARARDPERHRPRAVGARARRLLALEHARPALDARRRCWLAGAARHAFARGQRRAAFARPISLHETENRHEIRTIEAPRRRCGHARRPRCTKSTEAPQTQQTPRRPRPPRRRRSAEATRTISSRRAARRVTARAAKATAPAPPRSTRSRATTPTRRGRTRSPTRTSRRRSSTAARRSGKSPHMPANPDLDGKPELDGLVKVVREFKGT